MARDPSIKLLESIAPQRTLASTATIEGIGTFSGAPCVIRLEPAPVDTGLVFATPSGDIRCAIENMTPEEVHTSGLAAGAAHYRSVEHLLAAFHLMEVTNCRIVALQGDEVPNPTGGSCEAFAAAIERARTVDQAARRTIARIESSGQFAWERSHVRWEPMEDEALELHVTIEFPNPIGRQQAAWSNDPRSPLHDTEKYRSARSFLRRDLAEIRESGSPHWQEVRKTVRGLPDELTDLKHLAFANGAWVVAPQHPTEPAWHKLIDFAGDLLLLGAPVAGRIDVALPGHAFTHRLLHELIGVDSAPLPLTAALQ